jgi:hypothetical protein
MAQGNAKQRAATAVESTAPGHFSPTANFWTICPEIGGVVGQEGSRFQRCRSGSSQARATSWLLARQRVRGPRLIKRSPKAFSRHSVERA